MRFVEEIRKLTGGRYLVALEDGSSFPLYGKELDEFDVREGEALQEAAEAVILQERLPKRAKLCAMHYLQHSDRTEKQLTDRLTDLFYPEDIVRETVAYVKQYRYIDDLRYAVSYMEYRSGSKSLRQMEQELYGRGISKETFRQAVEQIEQPDEAAQIRQWLDKKHYCPDTADRRETERMMRFLARRGYGLSEIRSVMQETR